MNNNIGAEGMQHLLNASKNWPNLTHLNLCNNLINFQIIIRSGSKDKNALPKFVRTLKMVLIFTMIKVDFILFFYFMFLIGNGLLYIIYLE